MLVHWYDIFLFVSSQVNARNIDGSTPLCFACSKGCIQCTHLLVKAGAEVNPSLTVTFPPLHEAALNGHVRCIDLLLRLGADLERSENQFGTALHVACLRGYADCTRSLLHAGANPNAIKRHQSPLHTAALCGYEECAALLLEYGANVYQRNSQSKRPSDLATDVACKKILLSKAGEKIGLLDEEGGVLEVNALSNPYSHLAIGKSFFTFFASLACYFYSLVKLSKYL